MACCGRQDEPRQKTKEIDKQIREERKDIEGEVKILLLGAGESGKSTFAKQLRIIHTKGFEGDERMSFVFVVRKNIIDSLHTLIRACDQLGISLLPETKEFAHRLVGQQEIHADNIPFIKALWKDAGIQQAIRRASEFQYFYATPYYIAEIDRIGDPNYVPTDQDILNSRFPTTGIVEIIFQLDRVLFRVVDVGGQRSERRKWLHCFADVKAVVVLVGTSEYDQVLREDHALNRMHDALKLFKDISASAWFKNASVILFLNKIDLFREKIKTVPLSVCWPEYKGGNSFDETISFVDGKFRHANADMQKRIYTHLTSANDTSCMVRVFSDVKESILQDMLTSF